MFIKLHNLDGEEYWVNLDSIQRLDFDGTDTRLRTFEGTYIFCKESMEEVVAMTLPKEPPAVPAVKSTEPVARRIKR